MHVATLTLTIYLHEVRSLKEKRQIVQSLIDTMRRKYNVSIAEVDGLDVWQEAVLGVACVSNDNRHLQRVLDSLLNALEANPNIDVGPIEREIW
ncbi:hypothetical protein CWRG_02730 [Chthonomonas calidirosea]|uniref:Uncharacterized protein conserved in bacteria n=1 Tax=Chthonomonas calidirosea (strain DSM 23976 / ICMP 18418 / T49) TaxID=1303518 RepID=S0EU36_CHTCT|nr:DUF503 domain-containing protein [Chthonomonas calidirosea]CCW35161.1 Uncharacterized protein conserved in bacteria [Chthonomonas calidirosea T49]CEK20124.1 hypothetical protein CP488_02753 [Chthonomonas calidirosea]CEK20125.1 hypothetical protein CWRG_02730 [Chthonomonas calidirosea]CEK20822.1 hypothetical protein CTKA_02756 [Chthonomonas calidirosea]